MCIYTYIDVQQLCGKKKNQNGAKIIYCKMGI